METYIKKRVKAETMLKVFETTKNVNVRFFQIIDKSIRDSDIDPEQSYRYEIKVRHNEDEDPKKLLSKAIKKAEL